jgi:hypothetical protein
MFWNGKTKARKCNEVKPRATFWATSWQPGMSRLEKHLGSKLDRCFGLPALSTSKDISRATLVIRVPDKEGIQSKRCNALKENPEISNYGSVGWEVLD